MSAVEASTLREGTTVASPDASSACRDERLGAPDGASVGKRSRRAGQDAFALVGEDRGLDPMAYLPDMDDLGCTVLDRVLDAVEAWDPEAVCEEDVLRALSAERRTPEDFAALLSPAAAPYLEEMAQLCQAERTRWFGANVAVFTPLYLANYCENGCVYCGFNCKSTVARARLDEEGMVRELDAIAKAGFEEVLLLTGEDPVRSDVDYIASACRLAAERFGTVGVEVYPMNTADYRVLHEAGADYVTVFQETYDSDRYETLHRRGRKRVFPYRVEAQERALRAGMRGVAFAALLGLSDFRRDALACGLHAWELQRAYPHAEISFSCPRLRPVVGTEGIGTGQVSERELLQVICAYRLFMPQAGVTVSSRESARFRDNASQFVCTKVSAGVSTGVGEHSEGAEEGDEQFEIDDARSLEEMCRDLRARGLEPVMNDHVLV